MPDLHPDQPETLRQWLADRALGIDDGPPPAGADTTRSRADLAGFERAAATVYLGLRSERGEVEQPLSRSQRDRARAAFDALCAGQHDAAPAATGRVLSMSEGVRRSRPGVASGIGWAAAAALLVMWGLTTLDARSNERELEQLQGQLAQLAEQARLPEPSERWDALRDEPDSVYLDWSALEDPLLQDAEVSGGVVWNTDMQEGYMRFVGLPANDSSKNQYQLWIFDRRLPDATPVDGGVFDVASADGSVLVPIDPKLRVADAWRFAVTLEPPGGVVVSDREHLLLLADA